MNKNQEEQIKLLEAQLQWTQEQDRILTNIEAKLFEMKTIAEYAAECVLSSSERKLLNHQLNELKNEVNLLEKQLHTVIH